MNYINPSELSLVMVIVDCIITVLAYTTNLHVVDYIIVVMDYIVVIVGYTIV